MKSCPEFYTYAQDQCDQHSRFDSQLPATEQYFRFLILLRKRDLICGMSHLDTGAQVYTPSKVSGDFGAGALKSSSRLLSDDIYTGRNFFYPPT